MARLRRPERPEISIIPARIARFDPADWPAPPGERDGVTGDGADRFYARRRWRAAQRRYAAEHDMSHGELLRAIAASPGHA